MTYGERTARHAHEFIQAKAQKVEHRLKLGRELGH
jgi:hypothetical protein